MDSKLRRSARGKACQVRVEGCNGGSNNETVILAHLNGAGMALKKPDFQGAYCCANCHDVIDGRKPTAYTTAEIRSAFVEAVLKTQIMMFNEGLIKI